MPKLELNSRVHSTVGVNNNLNVILLFHIFDVCFKIIFSYVKGGMHEVHIRSEFG